MTRRAEIIIAILVGVLIGFLLGRYIRLACYNQDISSQEQLDQVVENAIQDVRIRNGLLSKDTPLFFPASVQEVETFIRRVCWRMEDEDFKAAIDNFRRMRIEGKTREEASEIWNDMCKNASSSNELQNCKICVGFVITFVYSE